MAWTNAFDIGACTLSVHKEGSATAMTQAEIDADNLFLEVSPEGLVSLISGVVGSSAYEVRITPSYETRGLPVRLVNVNLNYGWTLHPSWSPAPQSDPPDGAAIPNVDGSHQFSPDQPWTFVGIMEYDGGAL